MSAMRLTISLSEGHERTSVERAIAEMRMARPVLVEDGEARALVQGVEDLGAESATKLDAIAGEGTRLVLPAERLRRLGIDRRENGSLALPLIDHARIRTLAFALDARIDAPVRATAPLTAKP